MSNYLTVDVDTSAMWQPPHRSQGNGCLIGDGGSSASDSFWLYRPTGTEYDRIASGSDLYNAVTGWFSQRNAERVLCINTGSINAANVVDEMPRPLPDGSETSFFVSANPVDSIDDVTMSITTDGTTTTAALPDGTYSYTATQSGGDYTGEIVISPAPPRGARIYVDYTVDALSNAFRVAMSEDVQFVVLCNETNLTNLQYLANHVDLAFASLRFRMGVAMLPQNQRLTGDYRDWPQSLVSENMMLVAHTTAQDMAARYAGALSGIRVFDDPILMGISAVYVGTFSDNDRLAFRQAHVNCIDKYYSNESGIRGLRNFTLSGTSDRQYIDFVRTYQDMLWRLISVLDNPNVIGKITYRTVGMMKLRSRIRSAFTIPIQIGEIVELVGIDIPIEQLLRTPRGSRTLAEQAVIDDQRSRRVLENITVSYEAQQYVNDMNIILRVV